MALPANPNNNGKATKNTDVEVKVQAGKKRDKERKKCEPPARCSVKKKASSGDYDTGGIFKR